MDNQEDNKKLSGKKILLIILTIFILGPIVFVGTCFPLGFLGFGFNFEKNGIDVIVGVILFYGAWIIGAAIAIFVCYKVIKKIKNYSKENVASTN
jgi:uncharacterized BrkB/YihY/UPF0761 family membrane protein